MLDSIVLMPALATLSTVDAVLPLRVRYRQEMNCQIVHDSIHRRNGWTLTYMCTLGGTIAGFASVAIAGPWQDKPTMFEFYVLPEHRARAFDLFEAFLSASGARFMEIQSSDILLTVMLHAYARDIWSEKIVFHDAIGTALPRIKRPAALSLIARAAPSACCSSMARPWRPAASCFTTTCRTRISTWKSLNHFAAAASDRTSCRSSSGLPTSLRAFLVLAVIRRTSHRVRLFKRQGSFRTHTF